MNKIQIIVSVENRNIRVDIPINIYQSVNNDCNNGLKRKEFIASNPQLRAYMIQKRK